MKLYVTSTFPHQTSESAILSGLYTKKPYWYRENAQVCSLFVFARTGRLMSAKYIEQVNAHAVEYYVHCIVSLYKSLLTCQLPLMAYFSGKSVYRTNSRTCLAGKIYPQAFLGVHS